MAHFNKDILVYINKMQHLLTFIILLFVFHLKSTSLFICSVIGNCKTNAFYDHTLIWAVMIFYCSWFAHFYIGIIVYITKSNICLDLYWSQFLFVFGLVLIFVLVIILMLNKFWNSKLWLLISTSYFKVVNLKLPLRQTNSLKLLS